MSRETDAGPLTGNFLPNNPLSAFNGENPNGTWTLTAVDAAAGDTGSVRAFSLLFSAACATPAPTPFVSISGTVVYCSNPALDPVPGVTMSLTGPSPAPSSTPADGSGNYTLSGLSSGGSYAVTPAKTALVPGSPGIDTVDVIAIQRHFLVIGAPLSGCKLRAADVNGIGGIDTVDVIAVQRFFLTLTTGIANTGKLPIRSCEPLVFAAY